MKISKEKHFDNFNMLQSLFGELDSNVNRLREEFNVSVFTGNSTVKITGEEKNVYDALRAIDTLVALAGKEPATPQQVSTAVDMVKSGNADRVRDLTGTVAITAKGKVIRPKTLGQKQYVDAIKRSPVVFGVGPAGTGKTYLAVALAVYALKNHEIEKIILTRPAVEAGEKLGFLPGDLSEKVDPYLRPLFDALQEMMGGEGYLKHIERGSIEIAPLAYMRGRTLSNSFIILDEAQNTTKEQMKMFLTRMGENSRMVVTGDVTQIDLPRSVVSGMKHAIGVLDGVEGVEIVQLGYADVVRHEMVTRIVRAYEKAEQEEYASEKAERESAATRKASYGGGSSEDASMAFDAVSETARL
jgi:phosphate starvation-inducible PhoH-like protein